MISKLRYLLAICIGVLPAGGILLWYRLTQTANFTVSDMLVYPLVVGTGNILLILALNKYLLRQKVGAFSTGKGKWYLDILSGLVLTGISFLLIYVERATFLRFLSQGKPPSREIIDLMTGLAKNPLLLMLWLGPVVWIGVALYEEVVRVFFLNCLWGISGHRLWIYFSIFLVSLTTGLLHLYQGTSGIVSVTLQGLVLAAYYYKFRRLLPLVVSHALYDSIQIIMFVMQVS